MFLETPDILTVKKPELKLHEAKDIIHALEQIGYQFQFFEGALMVFRRVKNDSS